MNCFIRYGYCIFILLFLLMSVEFGVADEKSIICSANDINITQYDIDVRKSLLPSNFTTTDNEILRVVLMSRLFNKVALKKWADDKRFQKEVELELEQIIAKKYRQFILDEVDISEAVLKSYYLANPDKFTIPVQYKLSAIILNNKIVADETAKKIKNKTISFVDAAKKESIEKKTGAMNGDLGWVFINRVPAGWRKLIKGKRKGFISEPFFFDHKWYIIKFDDSRPSIKITFEQAKSSIKSDVADKEFQKAIKEEFEALKVQYGVRCK